MDRGDDPLGTFFRVLSEPNRLALLRQLERPRTIDEFQLKPSTSQGPGSDDRQLSREAIRYHLSVLDEAGLVHVGRLKREDGHEVNEYAPNYARLYEFLECLRELNGEVYLDRPIDQPTRRLDLPDAAGWPAAPRLVLAHGLRLGEAFGLGQPKSEDRGWVIGCSEDADISLRYDPYLSPQNSEILQAEDGFELLDLRNSENGTFLNGRRLEKGGAEPLTHGDVVRVGASMLVFHDRETGASKASGEIG